VSLILYRKNNKVDYMCILREKQNSKRRAHDEERKKRVAKEDDSIFSGQYKRKR
jgi:hypothetical protein